MHIYAGGRTGSVRLVAGVTANKLNEEDMSKACGTSFINYRFEVSVPSSEVQAGRGVFVNVIYAKSPTIPTNGNGEIKIQAPPPPNRTVVKSGGVPTFVQGPIYPNVMSMVCSAVILLWILHS